MDQLGNVLAQIAKQLGLTVDHLWPQLVLVTFYTSLAWAILTPLLIVVFVLTAQRIDRWTVRKMELENERRAKQRATSYSIYVSGDNAELWGVRVGAWVCAGFAVLIAVLNFPGILAGVFAPEGVTALNLLKTLTGK